MPEADAGPLYGWFDNTVLKGNNGPETERAGRIEVLGADMKAVVATVDLGNLGIVRYAPVSVVGGKEGARDGASRHVLRNHEFDRDGLTKGSEGIYWEAIFSAEETATTARFFS